MEKKGKFRKVEKVEVIKEHNFLKKGQVVEMHPVLAKRLIARDVVKVSKAPLTADLKAADTKKD